MKLYIVGFYNFHDAALTEVYSTEEKAKARMIQFLPDGEWIKSCFTACRLDEKKGIGAKLEEIKLDEKIWGIEICESDFQEDGIDYTIDRICCIEERKAAASNAADEVFEMSVRYKVSDVGVITDVQTNLQWYVGPDKDTNWHEARQWVDSLHDFDGGDWRMPSREELQGLYEAGKGSRNIDPVFLKTGWWVWSRQIDEDDENRAWGFNFYYGVALLRPRVLYSGYERVFAVRQKNAAKRKTTEIVPPSKATMADVIKLIDDIDTAMDCLREQVDNIENSQIKLNSRIDALEASIGIQKSER